MDIHQPVLTIIILLNHQYKGTVRLGSTDTSNRKGFSIWILKTYQFEDYAPFFLVRYFNVKEHFAATCASAFSTK